MTTLLQCAPVSDKLTRADFEKALNSRFTLMDGERRVGELELVDVIGSKYPTSPELEQTGRPFSAIFLGRHTAAAPQGLYTFETEKMGTHELFIVPIEKTAQGFIYEAVFN
jgi:hypothetical protein